jgi:hypothetical protein
VTRFFNSELVRETLVELDEMQRQIFNDMLLVPFYDNEQKRNHLQMMKEFLEKEKLFVFRLSLSDDPDAIKMKEEMLDCAELIGFDKNESIDAFFKILERTIDGLEKALDE